jgi:hypothetical protein
MSVAHAVLGFEVADNGHVLLQAALGNGALCSDMLPTSRFLLHVFMSRTIGAEGTLGARTGGVRT